MFKWFMELINNISGKTEREERLRRQRNFIEQQRLRNQERLLAALKREKGMTMPSGSYPSQRNYTFSAPKVRVSTHQPDNTSLHLGMMAMVMSEPTKPVESAPSCTRSYDSSPSYDSGSSSSYDSGSSSSSSCD